MMFINNQLTVIAFANGFTLWQYYAKKEDLQQVCAPDYFANVHTLMNVGDIIIIVAKDGTSIKAVKDLNPQVIVGELIK